MEGSESSTASVALSERSILKAFEILNENPETRREVIAELRKRIEDKELEGKISNSLIWTSEE